MRYTLVKSSLFLHAMCMALLLCMPLYAGDSDREIRGMLFDAAGITSSDVSSAASCPRAGLFELYVMSVAYTERLAIEGEYSMQAKAEHDSAFGSFLPKLSLRTYKTFPEPEKGTGFAPKTSVSLYARQNILTGLDEYTKYKGTAAGMRMRSHMLCDQAGKLLYDVAAVYLSALRVEKSLQAKQKIRENYRAVASEIEKRVALGRSRRSELLMIQSRIYELDANIESLENDSTRARNALMTLAGSDHDVQLVSSPSITEPPYIGSDPGSLLSGRYDLKASAEQVEAAKADTLAAYGGHLPEVYLEGSYRLYMKDMSGRDYYAGLGATLPIFSGGITTAEVARALSAERQAKLGLSQTRRNALRDIRDAITTYQGTGREVESYRKAFEMAEQNYASVLADYRLSLVPVLELLDALTTLDDARDALDGVTLDHVLSRVSLGVATGEFSGPGIASLKTALRTGEGMK